METILFRTHEGLLNPDENTVMFYGMGFKNIVEAIKFLKDVPDAPYGTYKSWYYNMHKGLKHSKTGQVYVDYRWLPDEKFAENYIDMKKKGG